MTNINLENITIILATYNGEIYLEELLESLLTQSHTNWNLIIHDDNSTDQTNIILKKYVKMYPNKIKLIDDDISFGSPSANFNFLLEQVVVDYIMFCDQDDIWLPNKMEITLQKMQEIEKEYPELPILIHTDLMVVDEKLNTIDESFWHYQHIDPSVDSLNRLLIQNTITGCTTMMNKKLVELSLPIPAKALMHDGWVGLVATGLGKISYIGEPTIKYRQHSSNDTGAKQFTYTEMIKKAFHVFKNDELYINSFYSNIEQAKEFLTIYKHRLDNKDIEMISNFIDLKEKSFWERKKTILKYKLLKQGFIRNIGLIIKI